MSTAFASLMPITRRPPITFTAGTGSWLCDSAGDRYLDFVQGWAVNCLGHAPPEIVQTISAQAETLINCSPAFYNEPMLRLADRLVHHSCFDQVFFANCGAEANEGAIKLARKWGQLHRGGASEIITMHHSFHGRTLATMSASGKDGWDQLFEPKVPGFIKVPLNDLNAVAAAISPQTVAVLVEPIQGEGGVWPATDAFMRGLRDLTRSENMLLIVDEIQTGMSRTATLFAYQHSAIEPDIMTLGKGMGGGVPLAALLARKEVCCFAPGDQGGTFNGSPLMTAVGCAVLEKVADPAFLKNVSDQGAYLKQQLQTLSDKFGFGSVRGKGLLLALDLKRAIATDLVERALAAGLLINAPLPEALRFMPALTVEREEIDLMIGILGDVCRGV